MKKLMIWIVLYSFTWYIILGSITGLNAQQQQQKKKKITAAVLTFETKGGISKLEASTLTDRFRSELVNLGAFTILERGQMNSILEEQGFQHTGCTSSECAVEAGRLLGVQLMIAGDVGKVGDLLTVDVRMFNVSSGKIVRAIQHDHQGNVSGLVGAMRIIARKSAGLKTDDSKGGGFPWLWVTLGAVVLGGGAAAVLLGGSDDGGGDDPDDPVTSLPGPNWPPGN